ncbi:MAG: ABC transporter ATP-binding protein [Spirochaetaceae bacterium]|nr:MAG: ABC transporter ATP-binding protein [Spirochaetaceae bacterium]
MTEIVRIDHVSKVFVTGNEQISILVDVQLTVIAGTVVVVTGESGSGKSTLLNILGGLESASGGTVRVAGYRVHTLDEFELSAYRAHSLGLVFQFHYLLKDFTALENVMLPAYMAGIPRREALSRARELLQSVGLERRAEHFPAQLSGGERQRVAVARALVNDPDVVLADEPTGNLDERNSAVVRQILFDMVRSRAKTLVLVTHDAALASYADRHLVLAHGVLQPV